MNRDTPALDAFNATTGNLKMLLIAASVMPPVMRREFLISVAPILEKIRSDLPDQSIAAGVELHIITSRLCNEAKGNTNGQES